MSYKLFDCDLKVPCDTFQCYGRAKYFLGNEDAPKSTLTKVCETCANELIEDIVNSVQIVNAPKAEALPFADEAPIFPIEAYSTIVLSDLTVAELKAIAADHGIEVKSKATKAEIIEAIEGAVNE